jgi:hypothetical protein
LTEAADHGIWGFEQLASSATIRRMNESADPANAEFELHKEAEHELARLLRDPRGEAQRLHDLADEGETAATPFIEIGVVARWVIPLVILVIGLALAVYYTV